MNRHLSEEEICRWLSGEYDGESASHVREHLAACEQCRREVGGTSEAFGGFQKMARREGAVRMASYSAPLAPSQRVQAWGWWPAATGMLAAAIIAVVLMLGGHASQRVPVEVAAKMTARTAERPDDDAAVLRRVDADLARTAPGPMEPLANLITEEQ